MQRVLRREFIRDMSKPSFFTASNHSLLEVSR